MTLQSTRQFNEIELNRIAKLQRFLERGEEPYPTRAERTHTISQARAGFDSLSRQEGFDPGNSGLTATLCGRLRSKRAMGKLHFSHIEDGSGQIQLMLYGNDLGSDFLKLFEKDYDLGDFVQASGMLIISKTGEFSLRVHSLRLLAKGISPLPAAKEVEENGEKKVYSAFANREARFRERYADLAVNPNVRQIFRTRSKIVNAIRSFLDSQDFLEVETPILQPLYGGAAARPFVTHHNQLHQDLYLRISFELYLKRLLVGNLERVYEIGRDFRNEGVSWKHNPEFTQLEFYWAYADYLQVMALTEQMIAHVAMQVHGSTKVAYQGQEIDFAPPWRRWNLRDAVLEESGIDIDQHETAESLAAAMHAKGLHTEAGAARGKLIDRLLSDFVEPKLIQPTFLYNYPRDLSPLAKALPGHPNTTERFEGYVAGMELCNAFTELNDPLDQEQRFLELAEMYGKDDEEKHPLDEDYLKAMSYGMPPNGGFGMGIDRLVMLMTDQSTIREVLLFPHLRQNE